MKITRTVAAVGVAALVGLTGLGAVAVAAPATPGTEDTSTGLVAALRSALEGLVGDGTLTGEQADVVAGTLAESGALRRGGHGWHGDHGGHGGHGGHGDHGGRIGRLLDVEVAATTLGLSTEELRTALSADGATLAAVAEDQGVERQTLVDALVAAATERVEAAVTDGRLTRAEADERLADLPARVAVAVDQELRLGHGHRHGGRGSDGACPDDGTDGGTGDDGVTPDPTAPDDDLIPGPDSTTGALGRSAAPSTTSTTTSTT